MTGELRGLLREELAAERPPPLGDTVSVALHEARRIRRNRRLAALGGGTAVAGILAVTVAMGGPWRPAAAPVSVGPFGLAGGSDPSVAPVTAEAIATSRGGGVSHSDPSVPGQVSATPAAMLVLLEELLPPGRTSGHARTGPRGLRVQLYLDRGKGPGLIRVSLGGDPPSGPATGTQAVSVDGLPDNCIQSTVVRVRRPGGLTVQADLATCLAGAGRRAERAPQALSNDEARSLVADPRWALTMDAGLVRAGAQRFPRGVPRGPS